MTTLTIEGSPLARPRVPWLDDGFRVFFPAAAGFAVVSIVAWAAIYNFGFVPPLSGATPLQWHAHEMIYGYAMAVVAGFLLTAIEQWTGVRRTRGLPLLWLGVLWLVPRVMFLFGTRFVVAAGVLDLVFMAALTGLITRSVVRSRRWSQAGVLGKLLALTAGQACFYLGAVGVWPDGVRIGVYAGLYVLLGLILTIARRVVPMFIERGLGLAAPLHNARWIDLGSLVLFVAFFVIEVFTSQRLVSAGLAFSLFVVHTVRLIGWYRHGIWSRPLLWSLYLAVAWIDLGFLLHAFSSLGHVPRYVALHAFAYGGVGLATLSMMMRVTLGHTGRSVHHPPGGTSVALGLLSVGALLRVVIPWWFPAAYLAGITMAQLFWIAGFAAFLGVYAGLFFRPSQPASS